MVFKAYAPTPLLAEYVRVYRLVHFNFSNAAIIPAKLYPPRPENTLSFYPRDGETIRYENQKDQIRNLKSALVGQHYEVTQRQVGAQFLVIQVVFHPGALFRLTGIPAAELLNAYVDAESIFSADLRSLNVRLSSAVQYEEMLNLIEHFLCTQVKKQHKAFHRMDHVTAQLVTQSRFASVDALAHASCLSVKQFERKFIERVGITPKYFSRIIRFEKAYRMKNMYPLKDWLSIALECGYHDYQHLTKDYIEFTGQTPYAFHLIDLKAPERAFGESDTF
jgi:AraC-like DNA-binding protein